MSSLYEQEVVKRTDFVEKSMKAVESTLIKNWSTAQEHLGDMAVRILRYSQTFNVAGVHGDIVSISPDDRHRNNIFAIALREGEQLRWDRSFCEFSSGQIYDGSKSVGFRVLKEVERRVAGSTTPPVELEDADIDVLRNRYRLPNFPKSKSQDSEDLTEFNLRPLIPMKYNESGFKNPAIVAGALYFADNIIQKPVILRSRDGEPHELYKRWNQEARDFGNKVLELTKGS